MSILVIKGLEFEDRCDLLFVLGLFDHFVYFFLSSDESCDGGLHFIFSEKFY